MARTCTKCGEALIGMGKFCASCGTPAPAPGSQLGSTLESKAHEPPKPRVVATTDPPPTRASVPGPAPVQPPAPPSSSYGPPPPPANPPPPQAQGYGYAPAPAPAYPPNPQPAAYPTYPPNPAPGYAPAPPPYAPPPPAYGAPFVAGSRVLVQWADGNRYPGIVQQVAPAHCFIVFPDGQQRWVELQYLTFAR